MVHCHTVRLRIGALRIGCTCVAQVASLDDKEFVCPEHLFCVGKAARLAARFGAKTKQSASARNKAN